MSSSVQAPTSRLRRRGGALRAYLALTKPRVIELLLVTTIPAMLLAQRDVPSLWLILATLLGGTMAAGSANALNCVADADIDAEMKRTRIRPLVTHEIAVRCDGHNVGAPEANRRMMVNVEKRWRPQGGRGFLPGHLDGLRVDLHHYARMFRVFQVYGQLALEAPEQAVRGEQA